MASWEKEFQRRALAAAGAPEGSEFIDIEMCSETYAYSEYAGGTDRWLEVNYRKPGESRASWTKFDSMAELIRMMTDD